MLNEENGLISVDEGGHSTCIVTKKGKFMFPSVKGKLGQRTITTIAGEHDYIVEYEGEKYVMGTLAKYDCAYPIQMHSDTKQHLFFDLSLLVSIHKYGYKNNYVVVSCPLSMHTKEEKEGRKKRLVKEHTIKVNNVTKTFNIVELNVAPEGVSAFWINMPEGKARYIDIGSRTIDCATSLYIEGTPRFIDSESETFHGKGIEALGRKYDKKSLADLICGKMLSTWNEYDNVFVMGGGALDEELVEEIKNYFRLAKVIDDPQMANAVGMYNLGNLVYKIK